MTENRESAASAAEHGFTPDELERFARVLEAERRARTTDAAALDSSMAQVLAARSDGTADDEHDPEGSTLTSDWSRLAGLGSASRAALGEIDRALDRIVAGSYGGCIRCGSPIGRARLEARPAAERCIDCARLGG